MTHNMKHYLVSFTYPSKGTVKVYVIAPCSKQAMANALLHLGDEEFNSVGVSIYLPTPIKEEKVGTLIPLFHS